ncbi:MAG: PHB depolymerase family esterase [Anaerolineaceae bacterium]
MLSFINRNPPSGLCRFLVTVPLLLLMIACGLPTPTDPPPSQPAAAAPAAEAAPLEPGDQTRSLIFDGMDRTYILHIPTNYDSSKPTPMVLAFHGIGLDAGEMIRISKLNDQADAAGFIAVYPDGTGEKKSWNGGHCCGEAAKNNVDDVGFTRALIDDVSLLAKIDPARVYATGFSNGAIFTYRLGCELADRIAAIGPVSATQILDDQQACRPARSMPVIHFHGTADRLNPYDGGTMASGFEVVPVDAAIQFWAQANACTDPPAVTETVSVWHVVYTGCAQNADVELYRIQDGEHAWPGGEAVAAQVGEPTMEISASPLMWEFFAAHPMP